MTVEKIIKSVATLTVVAAVLFAIGYLWKVVLYVIVAAVLAIVGRPLVTRLVKFSVAGRVMSRSVAAAITLLSMWIVFGVLCWLFIPLLFGKVNELAVVEWEGVTAVIESTLSDFELLVERIFSIDITDIGLTFKRFVLGLVDVDYVKTFANVASAISSAAIAFFSISFITFYFLKEDGLFYRLVALFFPDRYRTNVFNALNSITTLLSRYFGGLMVESLLLMTIISIAMMLFGMAIGDALLVGLIMGVMNLIPYAGPVMGCIVAVSMGVLSPIDGDVAYTAIIIVSTIVVVKVVDDFVIQPSLYSARVQAHPLEVFLVILIAGSVAGIWGMFLAIPLYTVVRVFAREFFSEYSLVRKLTSQMTK
ncbi:MAG: AI-2E family transporter [Alistipes sp.]|nr:AI-2E family transporter [Alistipes sp.]